MAAETYKYEFSLLGQIINVFSCITQYNLIWYSKNIPSEVKKMYDEFKSDWLKPVGLSFYLIVFII